MSRVPGLVLPIEVRRFAELLKPSAEAPGVRYVDVLDIVRKEAPNCRDEVYLDLITQQRIELLLSWRNSGFGVHNRTTVSPNDSEGLHKLACYFMRPPVNLSRLRYHRDSQLMLYEPKPAPELQDEVLVDPLEFLARVLIHLPEPHKHQIRFYGAYANRVRAMYRAEDAAKGQTAEATPRRTLSKRWRELIYRIYEVDPLTCPRCGATMKILAFIIDPKVIRAILDHLDKRAPSRAPPQSAPPP